MIGALLPGLATTPLHAGIDGEVVYARSLDGGATFEGRANLSGDTHQSELPHVAVGDGSVHTVWKSRDDPAGKEDIFGRRSVDAGTGFEGVAMLTAGNSNPSEPEIAALGPLVMAVYAEEVDGEDDVFAAVSDDGGASFARRVSVSASPTATKDPDVTLTEGAAVVVFEEEVEKSTEDIFVSRSDDGGKQWSATVNLSRDGVQSSEPAISSSGANVHVVWEDEGDELDVTDDRIGYARSTDGGLSWSDPAPLPASTPLVSPAVAVKGDTVHVAACSPADASGIVTSEAWYTRSTDGGATWGELVNLSGSAGDCDNPTVAAQDGRIYVAWSDTTGGRSEILLRRSGDDGRGFEATQNVSGTPGDSKEPTLAVDPRSGAVHLVWTDFSVQPAG